MYQKTYPVVTPTTKYAYAGSRLAILEKDLLEQSQFDQLKLATSVTELAKMLADTVYAGKFEGNPEIIKIVEEELQRLKENMYELAPYEDLWFYDAHFRKYDYNNLKICIKAYLMEKEIPIEDLSHVGELSPDELVSYFRDEKTAWLPFPVSFEVIADEYKREKEMRLVDSYIDRIHYSELLRNAIKLKDEFYFDFLQQQIDLKNLLIFIRCKTTGLPIERFLLRGGYLSSDAFEKFSEEPHIEVAFASSEFQNYRDVYNKGLETLEKTGSYAELETSFRNYQISLLREAQDEFFSIRPFIAYLYAKEHEINLIKKVYIHVHNGIEFGKERDLLYYE